MKGIVDTDVFEVFIAELDKYEKGLIKNQTILKNAANACDVAMGMDAIAQKYLPQLNASIKQLGDAITLCQSARKKMKEKVGDIKDIVTGGD